METAEQDISWVRYLWPLANLAVIFVLIYFLFFPYIRTEMNSWLHEGYKQDLLEFCLQNEAQMPRDIKIVDLRRHRYEIKFYCLYQDQGKNQEVVIHKTSGSWRVFSRQRLDSEGKFYWPLYF